MKTLVTSAIYDPTFNKPVQVTDPRGLVTTLAYDAGGNLVSVVANATGVPKARTSYSYTGAGLPLSVTDPVGTGCRQASGPRWPMHAAISRRAPDDLHDRLGPVTK